ncbi:MAG TPA: DUF3037 domain-containing protein [Cyclobacteriaceae bacterium]
MQGKYSFEYAVVRVVPHVEREEFFNAGIVLYCPDQKFLDTRFQMHEDMLRVFCDKLDIAGLKEHIAAFERVCKGGKDAGQIGKLPIAERFRWLTSPRSTVLQTSIPHPGLCDDAREMLEHLFEQLVGRKD